MVDAEVAAFAEFFEEYEDFKQVAERDLVVEALAIACDLYGEGLLGRSPILYAALRYVIIFQWPELGVNLHLTLANETPAYQLTVFDRTQPPAALTPPAIVHLPNRAGAVAALRERLAV